MTVLYDTFGSYEAEFSVGMVRPELKIVFRSPGQSLLGNQSRLFAVWRLQRVRPVLATTWGRLAGTDSCREV